MNRIKRSQEKYEQLFLKEQTVEMDNGDSCLLSRKAKSEYRRSD